jgi:2-polyprenyl-3-methyl-5-hydroxy-6-metoxy-1,4-benzoquinol methylase
VIVLNEMIYYTPSPRTLLRRIASIVRPGGVVLTSIWRHAGDRALWRLLDEELAPVAACRTRAENNPYNRLGWRVSCHRVAGG